MRVLLCFLVVVILLALGGGAWIYSGSQPVAATEEHTRPVRWVLDTAKRQGVRAKARDIVIPSLTEPGMVEEGARLFEAHCALCHGAPGVPPREFASAMLPKPPDVADLSAPWTPAELFWITRNGLRMTGMPAWTQTHLESGIWPVVAFLTQTPTMDAETYRAIVHPEPEAEPEPEPEPGSDQPGAPDGMVPPVEGDEGGQEVPPSGG